MIPDLSLVLLLAVAVGVGAFVQAVVGFGLSVVAAPVIVLFAPDLMPVGLLVCGFVLPCTQLVAGPRDIAWRELRYAVAGRLLLTPVGVWLVAVTSARGLAVVTGVMVLVVVILSLVTVRVRATPGTALAAGVLTGVSGTAAAIGGPFFAMTLQHESPVRIRSTLAAFFVVGSVMSLGALAVGGQVSGDQLVAGALWIPFLVLGYLASRPVAARVDPAQMRRLVLSFCSVASLVVVVRALLPLE